MNFSEDQLLAIAAGEFKPPPIMVRSIAMTLIVAIEKIDAYKKLKPHQKESNEQA